MGCLYYPRKQTSVSYAADCDVIICYGAATVYDKHLASKVHCVDGEIIEWLKRREQRRRAWLMFDLLLQAFPKVRVE
jgi:hypothetical protein